ncbi:hypothetical protein P5673_023844 [Acropora cervicornis]|uniref:Uncharacterized protein n=1 Tax=Acropora cervicornis TaxID=6130 RepID=A0AAD9UYF7_ACRCE|nr:hypothetical protein P5673_023844 [Acropora cervicornis]
MYSIKVTLCKVEPNTLPHQRVFDAEATNIRRIIRVLAKTPEKASQSSFCSDRLTGNHIVYFRVRSARYHRCFSQRLQVIVLPRWENKIVQANRAFAIKLP